MTWSAPMTAVAGATFTAAQFNQYVRDNLNETAVAKATALGQFFVATGVNSLAARSVQIGTVATNETQTTSGYADLATVGPAVTVSCSLGAIVWIQSAMTNSATNSACGVSFAISGVTSRAASDTWRIARDGMNLNNIVRYGCASWQLCNAGSNTFTAKYFTGSGTASFSNREIIVMPF